MEALPQTPQAVRSGTKVVVALLVVIRRAPRAAVVTTCAFVESECSPMSARE